MASDWLDEIQLPEDDWSPFGPNLLQQAVQRARELRPFGWRTLTPVGVFPIVMQRRQGLLGRGRRIQIVVREGVWQGGAVPRSGSVSVEGIGWTIRGEQDLL